MECSSITTHIYLSSSEAWVLLVINNSCQLGRVGSGAYFKTGFPPHDWGNTPQNQAASPHKVTSMENWKRALVMLSNYHK